MIHSAYFVLLWGLAIWLALIAWYWREALRFRQNRDSISLRIHVNGTRGKSSVTRLIAAGLRAGRLRTVAKTTGSAARLIEPNGRERPLKRRGPANIREFIPCIAHACSLQAQAFVAECMALQPDLQWFTEHRLLCSHIGVITNIRADHEDVMGLGTAAIAIALANTIPANGALVTGRLEYRLLSENGCLPPGASLHLADAEDLPADTFTGFFYEVFPQNVALALKVCELAGVRRDIALAGMRQAQPDPGNLTLTTLDISGASVTVINALAANDADSTRLLYKRYMQRREGSNIIWLHGRTDRKLRSVQLCRALSDLHDGLFLISGDVSFLKKRLASLTDRNRIVAYVGDTDLKSLLASLPQPVTIFAAGNIHGLHTDLINGLKLLSGTDDGRQRKCTSS